MIVERYTPKMKEFKNMNRTEKRRIQATERRQTQRTDSRKTKRTEKRIREIKTLPPSPDYLKYFSDVRQEIIDTLISSVKPQRYGPFVCAGYTKSEPSAVEKLRTDPAIRNRQRLLERDQKALRINYLQ
ncbi:hypothetical protein GCK72_015195 [Caenorhabditis remanei]|uniref:Uncharacterized protein n=1 Tax=Caenorhabditis remanei TaxID=31234 RepID=A0A6A5GW88_CAERE|nr:hypothetical protein GCK72_015195 [Caenorhabditis remanei]KAF1758735.1 hypothetical protein GCK72_015195 [Caenorhabditis remanei]